MVQVCHTPQQPLQNHPSGHIGRWAMPWSAEKMLDGQHQRLHILTHARTALKGLLQKRREKDLCWINPHNPLITQLVKGLNWWIWSRSRSKCQTLHISRKRDPKAHRSCHCMWHAQPMQVSIFWQLPEDLPVDLQIKWSCSASIVGLVLKAGDTVKFPHALGFESLDPFSLSQQARSISHSRRGGWRWQETCGVWTCLQSWWCCTTRSCCTGLLPGTWNWSPSLTSSHSC